MAKLLIHEGLGPGTHRTIIHQADLSIGELLKLLR